MALKKSQLYSSLWQSCDELRGGMDASQYKDYVLTLLFMKYVSDKYADNPHALIEVPDGGGYADMVKLRGDSLRLPTFTKFRFPLPTDIAEQQAIAAIITDLDAEIDALEARRDKYLAIKQGMMQQLLTGRVRLAKPASMTEGESAS